MCNCLIGYGLVFCVSSNKFIFVRLFLLNFVRFRGFVSIRSKFDLEVEKGEGNGNLN